MGAEQAGALAQAVWVSVLGMGVVFGFLLLLWAMLELQSRVLARLPAPSEGQGAAAGAAPLASMSPATSSPDDPQEARRRRAAEEAALRHHQEAG